MLHLSFAGTLGRDPETREAGSSSVTEFSVAVNGYDPKARAKTTTWLRISVWGKRGEQLAGLLSKGSKVAGSGAFREDVYQKRDGTEGRSLVVVCQDITLQGGIDARAAYGDAPKAAYGDGPKARPPFQGQRSAPASAMGDVDDDDVPF